MTKKTQVILMLLIVSWQGACVRQNKLPLNTKNRTGSEANKNVSHARQEALQAEVLALVADIKHLNAIATPDMLTQKESIAKLTPEAMQEFVSSELFDATMKEVAKVEGEAAVLSGAESSLSESGSSSDKNSTLTAGAVMMVVSGLIDMVPAMGHFYNATGHGSTANRWTVGNIADHGSNMTLNMANLVVGAIILGYGDNDVPKELVYTSSALLLLDAVFTLKAGALYAKEAYDVARVIGESTKDGKAIFVKETIKRKVGDQIVNEEILSPMSKAHEWDRRLNNWSEKLDQYKNKWSSKIASVQKGVETKLSSEQALVPRPVAIPTGSSVDTRLPPALHSIEFPRLGERTKFEAMIANKSHSFERIVDNSGVEKYKSDIDVKNLGDLMPISNSKRLYVGVGFSALLGVVSITYGAVELASSLSHVSDDLSLVKQSPRDILQQIDQRARRIYQLKSAIH